MSARLAPVSLDRLAADVARPDYDRTVQSIGIVHLGLGAFARAHQAVYTDSAMGAGDRDWAIAGVSLRSAGVRDALAPQDGLYTVTQRSAAGETTRLIGAVREVAVIPDAPARAAELLAQPGTRIVTLTVTEKAYHGDGRGDLDLAAADADGNTIFHHLGQGLARRRAAGLPGLTLISCDNLADNGGVLKRGLQAWLDRADPDLRRWFEAECACPATMVDRIVPAVTPADLDMGETRIGLRDEGALVTEPFTQWVIEDRFAGPRPRWEVAGALLVADVAPFEAAKLRMLNGAHSALAYLGLARRHSVVHQAIADEAIAPVIAQLMREAAASIDPAPGQDLERYAAALLARFRNPDLPHRLAQIAMDGTKKIPQRWLEPLAINAAAGRRCPATLLGVAAWLVHARGDRDAVIDPAARRLRALWESAGRDGIVNAVFGTGQIFATPWRPDDEDKVFLSSAIDRLTADA